MSLDNQLQILANEFVKEAQAMATDLHRAVTGWSCRFDDGESA